jgi:hypothetical protein
MLENIIRDIKRGYYDDDTIEFDNIVEAIKLIKMVDEFDGISLLRLVKIVKDISNVGLRDAKFTIDILICAELIVFINDRWIILPRILSGRLNIKDIINNIKNDKNPLGPDYNPKVLSFD